MVWRWAARPGTTTTPPNGGDRVGWSDACPGLPADPPPSGMRLVDGGVGSPAVHGPARRVLHRTGRNLPLHRLPGIWEGYETLAALEILTDPAGGIVVDLGAHVGWYTMLAASVGREVVAVDRTQRTCDCWSETRQGWKWT